MKIVLVTVNSRYTQSSLALLYLEGIAKRNFPEAICLRMEFHLGQTSEEIACAILSQEPDLVGFSVYLWNIEHTIKIADYLKISEPEIKLLAGGPEVSFNSKEFLETNRSFDFLIRGEGENAFSELLASFSKKNASFSGINGLIFRYSECIITNPERESMEDLDSIPSPLQLGLHANDKKFLHYESSRGCPFSCSYCLSSITRKVRYFSQSRVRADLDAFFASQFQMLRFVDRTFNLDRSHYHPIWEYIVKNSPPDKRYQFEIDAGLFEETDYEFLSTVPSGLFQFEIGIQTTNPVALRLCNRADRTEKIVAAVKSLSGNSGLHLHLDLISGLPGDDFQSFLSTIDRIALLNPETLQIGRLKVLKGSPLYLEAENLDLHFNPHPPYQVIRTPGFSRSEISLLEEFARLTELICNSERFPTFLSAVSKFHGGFTDFLSEVNSCWKKSGLNYYGIPLQKIFSLLSGLCLNWSNAEIFHQALLHDFMLGIDFKSSPDVVFPDHAKYLIQPAEITVCSSGKSYLPLSRLRIYCFDYDFLDFSKCRHYIFYCRTEKMNFFLGFGSSECVPEGDCLLIRDCEKGFRLLSSDLLKEKKEK
ncbi:MAG: radical SAM protein [Candidatus Wallbacteria bacterium]|nr:radical SAM protein [Candidatus Wallbacteria bacterium]